MPDEDANTPAPLPFNLIFMDVQMPNVDGLESTRLIRACGYREPIVALTAFAEESNIRDCLASGMNYFLAKPIRRPQLKKVLKQYIPPIPEESEDVSPSETLLGQGSGDEGVTKKESGEGEREKEKEKNMGGDAVTSQPPPPRLAENSVDLDEPVSPKGMGKGDRNPISP